jgi:hypothetical protein
MSTMDQADRRKRNWIIKLTMITAIIAWVLANGLDVLSVFFFLQQGGQLALVDLVARSHPTELALIYAGMRLLATLAVCLFVTLVEKHWSSAAQAFWSALTVLALITAVAAWLRIGQAF